MAKDVRLEPGWLIRDVRKASERWDSWESSRREDRHASQAADREGASQNPPGGKPYEKTT